MKMGYQTLFWGDIFVHPPLHGELFEIVSSLTQKRHCIGATPADPSFNQPPPGIPSLWCDWIPSKEGDRLRIRGKRPYRYVEWLTLLADKILFPHGRRLHGMISWQGEHSEDKGLITALGSKIVVDGSVTQTGANPFVEEYLGWELETVAALGGILHDRVIDQLEQIK